MKSRTCVVCGVLGDVLDPRAGWLCSRCAEDAAEIARLQRVAEMVLDAH